MRKLILYLLLPLAMSAAAQAPAAVPQRTAPAPIVSPEVLPDHRVIFRLRAPEAASVTITGDFWVQEGRKENLAKDAQGVWSLTTEPLTPDLYSYAFTVDGVPIPDPLNGFLKQGIRTEQSMFTVPGAEEAYLEPAAVPHGEVRIIYYASAVIGNQRRMHVYLPPGYEESKAKYPVVYLFHGGGDDDWGWTSVGEINFILDNLIAQGKAKPMIVVMPSVWAVAGPMSGDSAEQNRSLFRDSLVKEIIPYVESHYRVLPGAANRAAGGLGAGRDWLPRVVWPEFGEFNTLFWVSGGVDPDLLPILEKTTPGVLDNPANIRRMKFFLGDGKNDNSMGASKFLAGELKRRGYAVTTYETDGTHGWPSFRRCFAEFAKVAFHAGK